MSRAILGAFFGVLAALGLAGIFFSASALPGAIANFAGEPEDVYGAAFWLLVFLALFGAWSRAALLSVKRISPRSFDRYAAWVVLALGLALTAVFLLDPMDRSLSLGGLIILVSGGTLRWVIGRSKRAA
jgi:hypothetical protein